MRNYLLLLLAAVALCFTACKKENPESKPVAVTGVSLSKTMVGLEIDESIKVVATVLPKNATNKAVEWSVANTSVATVANGVVTAVAAGETILTATTADGGHTATIPVKVVTEKVPVTGISWYSYYGKKELKIGQTSEYVMFINPADATDVGVVWTSSNPAVATVKHKRTQQDEVRVELTAVAPGKVTVTCTTDDGGFSATTDEITVLEPVLVESIIASPESLRLTKGGVQQLSVSVYPAEADNKYYEVSSSNPSVVTIDANNKVTAVDLGEAEIIFKAVDGSGVECRVPVQVLGHMPNSIKFEEHNANSTELYETRSWHGKVIDFKKDLKMTVIPADADLRWIDWNITFTKEPTALKYEVTADNVTASVCLSENFSDGSFYIEALPYLDGQQLGNVRIYMQTFPCLFYSHGLSDNTTDTHVENLGGTRNYSFNWDSSRYKGGLNFITYCREVTAILNAYKLYQIPAAEYTLTSSDESLVKLTPLTTGEGYMLERLVWDKLVAVTLTYKCGDHTQTYTLNLIP